MRKSCLKDYSTTFTWTLCARTFSTKGLLPGLAVFLHTIPTYHESLVQEDYLFSRPIRVDVYQFVPRMRNAQGSSNHAVEQVFRLWKFLQQVSGI